MNTASIYEALMEDTFVFLEDVLPLPLVDDFLFLANAALPATVLVFNGVGLCTSWLDRIKAGSGRGP